MSKIQIWKQITTYYRYNSRGHLLFPICQRYKFESKSQLCQKVIWMALNCFRYVKDTNLKANHNYLHILKIWAITVSDMSKIQIWKQITTLSKLDVTYLLLFPICQRYKFESKSQLHLAEYSARIYCFRYVKDTNLKANHNTLHGAVSLQYTVSDMSKIQIWKQITT